MSLTGSNNEQKIWNYLIDKIKNPYGVAGLMGNMNAESGLKPNNLQNSYENKLGYTDESYTKAVDDGTYTNFVHDSAGYGLVQWTYWSLKEYLLNFAKKKGKSIGDLEMQLECVCTQFKEQYSAVWNALVNATSVLEASNVVLLKFERPADQSEAVQKKRAAYGQTYYDKYAVSQSTTSGSSKFVMRTTKPEKGNKYYITKANGGYSNAIQGKPTDKDCDVLSNCVGYAYGRFNEIGGYGSCKYLSPVNAENFIQYKGSLEVGQTPKLGACMVWQKGSTISGSDGAGHVAIVEKVISDTEVITSESGWGSSTPFWTETRKKGTGNWGQGSSYKFLGFIYNPAVSDNAKPVENGGNSSTTEIKYVVGNIVDFIGQVHYKSSTDTNGVSCKPGVAKITSIAKTAKHPYHLVRESGGGSTVYGWVDANTISGFHKTENKETTTTGGSKMKYNSNNKPLQCMMTQSTCYRGTRKMTVKGVLWHSTGANNPWLKRYVQPDDNASNRAELLAKLGTNTYKNDWNHIYHEAGLNCWIGKLADGTVTTVQTMPWDYRPWGCGSGSKGSCNDGWIQFEICEDGLTDKSYFEKVYKEACEITAYLCNMFGIDPNGTVTHNGVKVPTILCHKDSNSYGLGSNHGDVLHWFPKFGKNMNNVRADVAALLGSSSSGGSSSGGSSGGSSSGGSTSSNSSIKAGSVVKIASNATYYGGQSMPSWVKAKNWIVNSVSGDRVVIDKSQDGQNSIMSPVNIKYLTLVSGGSTSGGSSSGGTTTTTPAATVKAGAVVKLASNAVYYGGQAMPDWVKAKNWIVHSVSGDRVVIDKSQDGKNSIMSPVNIKYVTAVSNGSNSGSTASFTPYKVKVTASVLNIRKGAGTNYPTTGQIKDQGVYTIVAESSGSGATKWLKLKSGAGWIASDYTKKI